MTPQFTEFKFIPATNQTSPSSFFCLSLPIAIRGIPALFPTTYVFLQWCASEAASCPRPKTLNEDINFGLHLTAPLKKHFVGSCRALLRTLFVAMSFVPSKLKLIVFGQSCGGAFFIDCTVSLHRTEHTYWLALDVGGKCG